VTETVAELIARVDRDTCLHSSHTPRVNHPGFQRVVQWGPDALPALLEILQGPSKGSWSVLLAISAVAGVTAIDVGPEDAGRYSRIRDKWLAWGRAQGHLQPRLEAGTELDSVVTIEVMGGCAHEVVEAGNRYVCTHCRCGFNHMRRAIGEIVVYPYSSEPEFAWKVVEKLYESGKRLNLSRDLEGRHIVEVRRWVPGAVGKIWADEPEMRFTADTMPLAVCVAAVHPWLDPLVVSQFNDRR